MTWTPPPNTTCPQCGKPMVVRSGRFGLFTGCSGYPACDQIMNRFGFSDQPTRNARKAAHQVFDALWQTSGARDRQQRQTRAKLYAALSVAMNLKPEVCHIEGFNIDQCQEVILWAKGRGAAK